MARKLGRKANMFLISETDCLNVYAAFIKIQNGQISAKEAADALSKEFNVSVPTFYKLFHNMETMQCLLDNKVDMEVLQQLDNHLKVLNLLLLGADRLGNKII